MKFCLRGRVESKKVSHLRPVLHDSLAQDFVVYDVCRGEEEKDGIRKDLTLIYPQMLGREFPKTFGHYHKNKEIELYEVLEGEVLFLCQKYDDNPLEIKEAYFIQAIKGDKVVILPGFSMVSINITKSEALIANWVSNKIENQYDFFIQTHGSAYYVLRGKNGEIQFEKNDNYKQIAKLIKIKPKTLPRELKNLDFLLHPEEYKEFLIIEKLYEKLN